MSVSTAPSIHPIFMGSAFIAYADLNDLVGRVMQDETADALPVNGLEGRVSPGESSCCLLSVINSVCVFFQKIWHFVCMNLCTSYCDRFTRAVQRITLADRTNRELIAELTNQRELQAAIDISAIQKAQIKEDLEQLSTPDAHLRFAEAVLKANHIGECMINRKQAVENNFLAKVAEGNKRNDDEVLANARGSVNQAKKQLEINFLELDIKKISAAIQAAEAAVSTKSVLIQENNTAVSNRQVLLETAQKEKNHVEQALASKKKALARFQMAYAEHKKLVLVPSLTDKRRQQKTAAENEFKESVKEMKSLFGRDVIQSAKALEILPSLNVKVADLNPLKQVIQEAQKKYDRILHDQQILVSEGSKLADEIAELAVELQILQEKRGVKEQKLNKLMSKETSVEEHIQGDITHVGEVGKQVDLLPLEPLELTQ